MRETSINQASGRASLQLECAHPHLEREDPEQAQERLSVGVLAIGGPIPFPHCTYVDISLAAQTVRRADRLFDCGGREQARRDPVLRSQASFYASARCPRSDPPSPSGTANLLHPRFTFRWSGSETPNWTTW